MIRSPGSDVNTYHVLNKTLIVLNSREAIDALFTKQVENYSDKPPRKMADMYVVLAVSATLPR